MNMRCFKMHAERIMPREFDTKTTEPRSSVLIWTRLRRLEYPRPNAWDECVQGSEMLGLTPIRAEKPRQGEILLHSSSLACSV